MYATFFRGKLNVRLDLNVTALQAAIVLFFWPLGLPRLVSPLLFIFGAVTLLARLAYSHIAQRTRSALVIKVVTQVLAQGAAVCGVFAGVLCLESGHLWAQVLAVLFIVILIVLEVLSLVALGVLHLLRAGPTR